MGELGHLNQPLHDQKLQSFDKGMPQPKTRAEEKKQKAEQLANLLRIQKELSSDYKVCALHKTPCPTKKGEGALPLLFLCTRAGLMSCSLRGGEKPLNASAIVL